MGIGQALVHHCNPIAAYVGDLPSYILLLDIIFALDIQAIHAGEIDKRLLIIPIFVFVFVPIFFFNLCQAEEIVSLSLGH